jgi:hypothetical protein
MATLSLGDTTTVLPFPGTFGPSSPSTPPSTGSPTSFSLNPPSTSGSNPFGYIPGNVNSPLPNISDLDTQAGQDIAAQLSGSLSSGTLNALQDASATYGVNSGMPGSGLSWNSLFGNIAGASEQQQQQGLSNLNSLFGPNAQVGLAQQNAVNNAAPDPTQAANYAQQLFNEYLSSMRSPGGGTGGGSNIGNPASSSSAANPLVTSPTGTTNPFSTNPAYPDPSSSPGYEAPYDPTNVTGYGNFLPDYPSDLPID